MVATKTFLNSGLLGIISIGDHYILGGGEAWIIFLKINNVALEKV